jgi:cytidine deaminase
MDYFTPNGEKIVDFEHQILYDLTVDLARTAKTFAIKSNYEVRSAALQIEKKGKTFFNNSGNYEIGKASHSEILSVIGLMKKLPNDIPLSVDILTFYNDQDDGRVATICGLCRDGLRTVYNNIPIMSPDSVVIGAGNKTGIIVPWSSYLSEDWKKSEIDGFLGLPFDEAEKYLLEFAHPIYTKKEIAGGWLVGSDIYLGAAQEFSSAQRSIGPIDGATLNYLIHAKEQPPDAFIFVGVEELPEVTYSHRQIIIDQINKRIPVEDAENFKIIRASLHGEIQESTLGKLMPYRFTSK